MGSLGECGYRAGSGTLAECKGRSGAGGYVSFRWHSGTSCDILCEMQPQSRVGDRSHVPADSHDLPCCAHSCTGPALTGSPDIFINGKAAVRVTDTGEHSHCCGDNTWEAVEGSESVLFNNLRTHRLGDKDQHCGGPGHMIDGSPDVLIGD